MLPMMWLIRVNRIQMIRRESKLSIEGFDCDSRDHVEQFVGICLISVVVIDNAQVFA